MAHNQLQPALHAPSQRCDVYDPLHTRRCWCCCDPYTRAVRAARGVGAPQDFAAGVSGEGSVEKPALMGGVVCGDFSSAGGSWADERGARSSRGKEPLKPQDQRSRHGGGMWGGQWGGWKYDDLSTHMLAGIWRGLSLQLLHTKRLQAEKT